MKVKEVEGGAERERMLQNSLRETHKMKVQPDEAECDESGRVASSTKREKR